MLTQDRAVAEEIVQEAFVRVWASSKTPSVEAEFRRWLYRVITNLARDHHRRRRLQSALRFWSTPPVDPIEEVARRAEDRELLMALRSLAMKDRQAIYLHYFEGQSFAEVAAVLGMREGAARVRVHRALRQLRRRLAPKSLLGEVSA